MNRRQYIRTDKNGTKIYHDYTCPRCGGQGGADQWKYTGWTCYDCGGTGIAQKPTIIKEYTPEYRALLDARNEKRREKKRAEEFDKNVAQQAEFLSKKGFADGKIHVVTLEDTYALKDQIKAAGGRYDNLLGWYFPEKQEAYQTVELTKDECFHQNAWGNLDWNDYKDIQSIIKAKMPQQKASEFIGQIGGKIDIEATYIKTAAFDTHYSYYGETTYIHQFKDDNGNILVWKTANSVEEVKNGEHRFIDAGSRVRLKGTVKDHNEYREQKQTALIRCKVATA